MGISWNLSNVLTVQGQGFFAITPQVCMGGGQLLATFRSGPIYAQYEISPQAYTVYIANRNPHLQLPSMGVVSDQFQALLLHSRDWRLDQVGLESTS